MVHLSRLACVVLFACGHPAPQPPVKTQPKSMTEPLHEIDTRIQDGGVGPVELGKKLPDQLLVPDLETRYVARYIADAQPIDAFEFADPPLLVLIADGPFAASGDEPDGASERFRGKAAAAARGGAIVQAVLVRGAGPRTAAGVGVGSKLAELEAAYSDLAVAPRPPTLGKDGCVARSKSLPHVAFVFASCDAAKAGEAVVRVDLMPD